MYNIQKYNTFLAIKECTDADVPATMAVISILTGVKYDNISSQICKYHFKGYLKRKALYENKRVKGSMYSLTSKGKSVLERFSERQLQGYDLNIRRSPRYFDWSKVELLPGLHYLEELKKNR